MTVYISLARRREHGLEKFRPCPFLCWPPLKPSLRALSTWLTLGGFCWSIGKEYIRTPAGGSPVISTPTRPVTLTRFRAHSGQCSVCHW